MPGSIPVVLGRFEGEMRHWIATLIFINNSFDLIVYVIQYALSEDMFATKKKLSFESDKTKAACQ